jgi:hypothetical protein
LVPRGSFRFTNVVMSSLGICSSGKGISKVLWDSFSSYACFEYLQRSKIQRHWIGKTEAKGVKLLYFLNSKLQVTTINLQGIN